MTPMPTTHLLYLHGFRSSPASAKAQRMAQWIAQEHPKVHWWCPQLPPSPRDAAALLVQGMAGWPAHTTAVVGSSLGGYYASWIAQQLACRSVLINPAVSPARDLANMIGEHAQWHAPEECLFFKPQYIDELRELDTRHLNAAAPELALIAQGDEVLDWREMSERYPNALQIVQEGGDHALSDFEDYLPQIQAFLRLL
jgi:predicted esterase YcpF (UPF0227 family)